ncbi:hypothetical protein EMCG_02029 [[Emmonsia] crescens]|uniref:Uncharacterized protein n=1 Tax=[Emmonsia] crescens TaxID=73230 RepID=A0A0G2J9A9_9EURO|nr:hypothetical protein EMCG_02029 [Emmonsia crescens UAMH 3008]
MNLIKIVVTKQATSDPHKLPHPQFFPTSPQLALICQQSCGRCHQARQSHQSRSLNIAATAAATVMEIHPATIRTHMHNEAWCHDNRHLIDHFKAQHEKYTKNSPANPIDNQDIQYASAAIPIGFNSFQIAP